MTLDFSTVVSIVSAVSALANGWLINIVTSLRKTHHEMQSEIAAQKLALSKLDGDLRVEIAERNGIDANITRIDGGVREMNNKLDVLLGNLGNDYIPREWTHFVLQVVIPRERWAALVEDAAERSPAAVRPPAPAKPLWPGGVNQYGYER